MGSTRTSILEILRNANSPVGVLRSSRAAHHRKTSQIGLLLMPRVIAAHLHPLGQVFARQSQEHAGSMELRT
jgi:hypothetical protein